MGGIFLFFACFMIDYCVYLWHNYRNNYCEEFVCNAK